MNAAKFYLACLVLGTLFFCFGWFKGPKEEVADTGSLDKNEIIFLIPNHTKTDYLPDIPMMQMFFPSLRRSTKEGGGLDNDFFEDPRSQGVKITFPEVVGVFNLEMDAYVILKTINNEQVSVQVGEFTPNNWLVSKIDSEGVTAHYDDHEVVIPISKYELFYSEDDVSGE